MQESIATEDPYLASVFATAMTRGHQNGEDARFWLSAATLKHAFAYSLEDYTTPDGHWMRQTFNAVVSPFDLVDTYTPAFAAAITDGGAAGVMYSANELNGVPCALDVAADELLNSWVAASSTVANESTGAPTLRPFYRATDGGQIINGVVGHHFVPTLDQAIGFAVRAESDIADGSEYYDDLTHAIMNGNTTLEGARAILANTLRVRMKLGLFDPAADQPYTRYGESDIADAAANASIALAARQGLVLLVNKGGALPFSRSGGSGLASVAVIGPNADSMTVLGGNYLGQLCPDGPHGPADDCHPSIFEAIAARAPDALYAQGSAVTTTTPSQIAAAVAAVKGAERVVLVLGLDQTLEREQLDRVNISLPFAQQELFAAVAAAAAGKPVAVVLVHGGAVSIPEIAAAPGPIAVIDAFYPGVVAGAQAIAAALYGDFSPSGKLPYSIPFPSWAALSNFTSMDVASNGSSVGRTYRYVREPLLFEFGYGLSFTTWALAWSVPPPNPVRLSLAAPTSAIVVTARVTNTGLLDADEVVQLYSSPTPGSFGAREPPSLPRRALIGFQRVHVPAGGSVDVPFSVAPVDLALTAAGDASAPPAAGGFAHTPLAGAFVLTVSRGTGDVLTADVIVGP